MYTCTHTHTCAHSNQRPFPDGVFHGPQQVCFDSHSRPSFLSPSPSLVSAPPCMPSLTSGLLSLCPRWLHAGQVAIGSCLHVVSTIVVNMRQGIG